jgi:hypothetical protein
VGSGLEVDHQLALTSVLGAGRGLESRRLSSLAPTLHAVHSILEDARSQGQVPLCAQDLEREAEWAESRLEDWRDDTDRLVLVGEPGAIRGLTGLASAGDLRQIRWIDGPDPYAMEVGLQGAESPRIIVLGGPGWIPRLAR